MSLYLHNAELCTGFQDCFPIKQHCLDLGLSEQNYLASILLLRFLEFYTKESLKINKRKLRIAENESFLPIFALKARDVGIEIDAGQLFSD